MEQRTSPVVLEDPLFLKISLICTILAINNASLVFQNIGEPKTCIMAGSHNNFRSKSSVVLFNVLPYIRTNVYFQELVSNLVEISIKMSSVKKGSQFDSFSEKEILRQYLKKFAFYYKFFYLKAYPNNLARISLKNMNMLAVQSLFILNGL